MDTSLLRLKCPGSLSTYKAPVPSSSIDDEFNLPSSYSIILKQRSENHKKQPEAPKNNTSRRAFILPPNRSAHLARIKPAPIPAIVA